MKPRLIVYGIILFILLLTQPFQFASAQQGSITLLLEQAEADGFPEVDLLLNAWGEDGLPLSQLDEAHFSIQEDGGAALQPNSLVVEEDALLSVVLVVDISASMKGQPLADAKAAAARFLDRLSDGDRVALIAFSDQLDPDPNQLDPDWESAFTSDLGPVYDLIEGLEAGRGTHLYQAVSKGVQIASQEPAGHRAVLLLSDGRNDPPLVGDPDEPAQLARDAHIPIFVIGLGSQIDEPYLRSIADETGGLFRLAPRSSELAGMFGDMATLLKTQYRLSYTSQLPPDGEVHRVAVTLDSEGQSAAASIEIGPLPYIPTPTPTATHTKTTTPTSTDTPTKTPTQTDTPQPPATQTVTDTPTPIPPTATSTATATATPTPMLFERLTMRVEANAGISLCLGPLLILLLGLLLWWLFFRRKDEEAPDDPDELDETAALDDPGELPEPDMADLLGEPEEPGE